MPDILNNNIIYSRTCLHIKTKSQIQTKLVWVLDRVRLKLNFGHKGNLHNLRPIPKHKVKISNDFETTYSIE